MTKPLLYAVAGLSVLSAALVGRAQAISTPVVPPPMPAPTAPGINLRNTVTVDVVKRVAGAVVYISTEKRTTRMQTYVDGLGRPVWQVPKEERETSLGSGFIVHEQGYIVTNNHVIDGATTINVTLNNSDVSVPARIIQVDAENDLAVLKIESRKPLPRLELGDSEDLMIGEPVIAVGNPLGFSSSVSTGIVSAMHREIRPAPNRRLKELVQTDAAINPGNSGGPLLNAYGQVIGINTAIVNDAQNIGFAIRVNHLRDLIPKLMNPERGRWYDAPIQLQETRKVTPPATVTPSVEIQTKLGPKKVLTIAGKKPRDIVDAEAIILGLPEDKTVHIVVDGGELLAFNPVQTGVPSAIALAKKRLGVVVEPVTSANANEFGLTVEEGMLVREVVANSPAERSGIKPGDVILAMGRGKVHSTDDFSQLMGEMQSPPTKVVVAVLRKEQLYETYFEL